MFIKLCCKDNRRNWASSSMTGIAVNPFRSKLILSGNFSLSFFVLLIRGNLLAVFSVSSLPIAPSSVAPLHRFTGGATVRDLLSVTFRKYADDRVLWERRINRECRKLLWTPTVGTTLSILSKGWLFRWNVGGLSVGGTCTEGDSPGE